MDHEDIVDDVQGVFGLHPTTSNTVDGVHCLDDLLNYLVKVDDVANETNLTKNDLDLLRTDLKEQLENIFRSERPNDHYGIIIDARKLLMLVPFMMSSTEILEDKSVFEEPLAKKIFERYQNSIGFKQNIHLRFSYLPLQNCRTMNELRVNDIGKLIELEAVVVQIYDRGVFPYVLTYNCSNQDCGYVDYVKLLVPEVYSVVQCQRNRRKCTKCNADTHIMNSTDSIEYADVQMISVQPPMIREESKLSFRSLSSREITSPLKVLLLFDLVGRATIGKNIRIVGRLEHLPNQQASSRKYCSNGVRFGNTVVSLVLEKFVIANFVEDSVTSIAAVNDIASHPSVMQQVQDNASSYWETAGRLGRELCARDYMIEAFFCPKLHGMFVVKLSALLCFIGGGESENNSEERFHLRHDCHLLLVGDPGLGKTQILQFISKLADKSIFTSGQTSSAAGLTCAAVPSKGSSGGYILEAGALVLADGGVCCVDEFNKLRIQDQGAIHEAMEQQTLSIAKAGINTTLNTRTSIFAATNPKGKFEYRKSLEDNIGLGSALLSRFDLIFVLLDVNDKFKDAELAKHVLGLYQPNHKACIISNDVSNWTFEEFKAYISLCKRIRVNVPSNINLILETYFERKQNQMQSALAGDRRANVITRRTLESLHRLTKAHARLMLRSVAKELDAIMSIFLMETAMTSATTDEISSLIFSCASKKPEEEFKAISTSILNSLGINTDHHKHNDINPGY